MTVTLQHLIVVGGDDRQVTVTLLVESDKACKAGVIWVQLEPDISEVLEKGVRINIKVRHAHFSDLAPV